MNFYKKHKLAFRGNIPRMEDPDSRFYDPYKTKSSPGDGQGTKLNTPGSEETNPGSFGGRARGATFPDDFSPGSDYAEQKKKDIPTSDHMFISDDEKDDGMAPIGEGANDDRFVDSRDKIPDNIDGSITTEPAGPHNMQNKPNINRYKSIIDRTRRKVHTEN